MAVVNNIKEIREQRGIYQDELAEATGYCTKTIGRIERGESTPSAEFMLRISKYFNMMVEDVFHVSRYSFLMTYNSAHENNRNITPSIPYRH